VVKFVKMLEIIENEKITDNILRMKLYSPEFCCTVQAGQFFYINCGGDKFPLLRRPISLAYLLPREEYIVLVYRVEGQGTTYLSRLKTGEKLDVMGPLGRGFHIDESYRKIAVVGGGMGIAPLVELAGIYREKTMAFLGYCDTPFLLEEIRERIGNVFVSSESGCTGYKGYVTDLLPEQLEKERPDVVYCCGPRPMMKKVLQICRDQGIRCQVSLEERMGCGIGACLVCSCAARDEEGNKTYLRVCKDGPVFWGEEVLLDD